MRRHRISNHVVVPAASVAAALCLADSAHAAPLDPTAFTSLGSLSAGASPVTINTDTLSLSVGSLSTFTGVSFDQGTVVQNGVTDFARTVAVFDFSDINIGSFASVTVTGSRPLALLSRGNLLLQTSMSVNGGNSGGSPGIGGPGGGAGGASGTAGVGPGRGGGGSGGSMSTGGGGGGFGGPGSSGFGSFGGSGGLTYGGLSSLLQGGSGGGGGGALGGGGAGALELGAVGTITTTAAAPITANGGAGGSGAGAGGGLLLHATNYVLSATAAANGGVGGVNAGGGGGGGRITFYGGNLNPTALLPSLNADGGTGSGGFGTAGVITFNADNAVVASGQVLNIGATTGQTGRTDERVEIVVANLTVQSGGTATLTGPDGVDTNGGITVQGSGLFNAPYNQTIATLSGDGKLQLGGGSFFTFGASGLDSTFSGTTTGGGTLIKTGAGFLTLTGNARLDAPLSNSGGVLAVTGTDVRVNALSNGTAAEVRLGAGQRLRASGTSFNSGLIDVIGNASAVSELEFTGAATNQATGTIVARNATLRFDGGLTNNNSLNFSFGTSDVFGNITNNSGGKVILSGNSNETFYNNVSGNSGSEFRVSSGSTAVFFGFVTGTTNFTGGGTKFFEGGSSASIAALESGGITIVNNGASLVADDIRESQLTVGGFAQVRPNGTNTGTSRVNALSIPAGGTFDLTDNDLVVDYTGSSPIPTIQNQLKTAYANGPWTGGGLTSSSAAAASSSPHRTALGYAEATNLFTSFPATFSGQSVDNTSVLVRCTYAGDANLDTTVDTIDFNLLAASFSQTGKSWFNGDFDYNGTVDTIDFNLLASNFALSLPAEAGRPGTLVPEPVIAIPLLACLLTRRRRGQY